MSASQAGDSSLLFEFENILDHASAASRNPDGDGGGTRGRGGQKSSLFRSPVAPALLRFLLPLLLAGNHVLFYYAQTQPMWRFSGHLDLDVSVAATSEEAKDAAQALNFTNGQKDFVYKESVTERTFTFAESIRAFWTGADLGGPTAGLRTLAAALVCFSGIWPHLKLALLQWCWFVPFVQRARPGSSGTHDKRCRGSGHCCVDAFCLGGRRRRTRSRRTPLLRAIAALGKFSLADVLVVCAMIAVLRLDFAVAPDEIRAGAMDRLPGLLAWAKATFPDAAEDCGALLGGVACGSDALEVHEDACAACTAKVAMAFGFPALAVPVLKPMLAGMTFDGAVSAQMRVKGLSGVYFFCGAVLMSILLSVIVEFVDERERGRVEAMLPARKALELTPSNSKEEGPPDDDASPLEQDLLQMDQTDALYSFDAELDSSRNYNPPSLISFPTTSERRLFKRAVLAILSLSSLPLVCYALTLPTMHRLLVGGFPKLVDMVLNTVWEEEFSLISTMMILGDAGGWDLFLMLTFGLFVVVGPLARSLSILLHFLLGLPVALSGAHSQKALRYQRMVSPCRKGLVSVVDALGAFCCWEVLFLAFLIMSLEFPSLTDFIKQSDFCQKVDPEHGRTCIEVQFNFTKNMVVLGVAWISLVVASRLTVELAEYDRVHLMSSPGRGEKGYVFDVQGSEGAPGSTDDENESLQTSHVGQMERKRYEDLAQFLL